MSVLPTTPFPLKNRAKSSHCDGGERGFSAYRTSEILKGDRATDVIVGETVDHFAPTSLGYSYYSSWKVHGHNVDKVGGAWGASSGKGKTEVQARVGAVAEAIERYSAQYCENNAYLASYEMIQGQAVHPQALCAYSDRQFDCESSFGTFAKQIPMPKPYLDGDRMDWTPAWSVVRASWVWVPSAYVYFYYPRTRGGQYLLGDSNGVSAGNSVEESVIQGFFELVERDAVGAWWYGMHKRPSVDITTCGSFVQAAKDGMERLGYELVVLDLTTDFEIPVFACVGLGLNNPNLDPVMGFGAHFDPRIAVERAVTEMGQGWPGPDTPHRNEISLQIAGMRLSEMDFIRPSSRPSVSLEEYEYHKNQDFLDDVFCVSEKVRKKGLDLLLIDMTPSDICLKVVRVIVPGLAHVWPRFANKRLFDLPMKLGWVDSPVDEEDLNPVPYLY